MTLERKLTLLTWMVGCNLTFTIALLWRVFTP